MTITQRPKTPTPTITPTAIPAEPVAAKGLTPQQRQTIGIVALVVCLLLGAGIVWWLLFGASPKRRMVEVDSSQSMRVPGGGGGMRAMPRPRDMRGVIQAGDGKWTARGDNGAMLVSKNSDGSYRLNFYFPNALGLARDQVALVSGLFRIQSDPAMAKEWQVTDEQSAKLKQIKLADIRFQPGAADMGELRGLWQNYLGANGGPARLDAQKKLADKLDAIGKANLAPTKAAYAQRIDQIKQILTPAQVQKITQ